MAEWQLRDERIELQKRTELDHSSSTQRKNVWLKYVRIAQKQKRAKGNQESDRK